MSAAIAVRPVCGRCHHLHADHVDWELAPQCASKGCTCLAYRAPGMVPASRAASAVTPMRAHTPPAAPRPAAPAAAEREQPHAAQEFSEPADEELTIEQLLERGRASELAAIVKLADRVGELVEDLRERLADEAAADGVKRLVADLEKKLADAKEKLRDVGRGRRKTPPDTSAGAAPVTAGEHACTRGGCDRTFATPQARAMHERRAHDGFNPGASKAK